MIISRLEKGEKGINLVFLFKISKQQILKFTNSVETREGLKQKSLKECQNNIDNIDSIQIMQL